MASSYDHDDLEDDGADGCSMTARRSGISFGYLARDPDAETVPGGDRIDTFIATIVAFAPLVATSPRYAHWINILRYQEGCLTLGLDATAPTDGFERQRPDGAGYRHSRWVWSDEEAPVLANHTVRLHGRSTRYAWSRDGVVTISGAREAELRKEHRQNPKRTMSRLMTLARLVGA